MAAFSAVLTSTGTGGHLSLERLQRAVLEVENAVPVSGIAEWEHVRTPSDDLTRIREVIHPAISDLATTLGVSRQSVYNWINGDPVAAENAAKLHDLAQAADILANEGLAVNAALLQRKFANGKTLLQIAQAGEPAREAALLMVNIHKLEVAQRERMNARFANRAKTTATADFDLPAASDKVRLRRAMGTNRQLTAH
jgi:transcriptional regulator with XRE-family HTH domain